MKKVYLDRRSFLNSCLQLSTILFWIVSLTTKTCAHPCDTAVPDTRVCDPSTGGRTYFLCEASGLRHELSCPENLIFNNAVQVCDWNYNTRCAPTGDRPQNSTSGRHTLGTCNSNNCQLPQCRCVGTDIPGGLDLAEVPQMVLVTFDDYVTRANFHFYDDLFPRALSDVVKNPNGCPATATFFVSGTHTNMTMVKTLADRGHEIASHSHTHGSPGTWSRQDWDREIQGMRQNLAHACQLPAQKVCGMRAPFLELGGDDQFSVLQDRGFLYDSSMFGGSITEDSSAPPLWPFTLHYPPSTSQTVCDQSRCPGRSYSQIWEVPLIRQYALDGRSCAMTDGCPFAGDDVSKDDVKRYLRKNFDRHYNRNRAPFMISLHATWFTNVPQSYQGLQEFLQEVSSRSDVWQVTLTQMLDWVRHPVPLSRVGEIPSWQC